MSIRQREFRLDAGFIKQRPGISKRYTIEIKPETNSDEGIHSGYSPIVSPEVHEDWQLVSAKTPTGIYDLILSKLNPLDTSKLKTPFDLSTFKSQKDTDWEFWASVMTDFQNMLSKDLRLFRHQLAKGVPPPLRGFLWQAFSGTSLPPSDYRELLYRTSPHEKLIRSDLPRAFPEVDYFTTPAGQESLFRVIKAYSLTDEDVGYCQGIHFIAGCLLLHMREEAAFSLLCQLMTQYGLRGQFMPKMERLQERLFQFEKLLSVYLPRAYRHLDTQGVLPSMYASQWFMTLFVYRCPLELVYAIFDVILVEGADMMLHFGLALIQKNEPILVCLDFEALLDFFHQRLFDAYRHQPEQLVQDAYRFSISPQRLSQLVQEHKTQQHEKWADQIQQLEAAYVTLEADYKHIAHTLAQANQCLIHLDKKNQQFQHELGQIQSKQPEKDSFLFQNHQRLLQNNTHLQTKLLALQSTLIHSQPKEL
ncbi:rab-GTPase-TBC domain-containing protein [Sporodiniella umbellata]|nr:rab-GTPase-TBC domain-containing protein [Sporodiniella umbellata]